MIVALLALAAPVAAFALTQTRSLAVVVVAQAVLALLLAIMSIRAGKLLHDGVPSHVRAGVSSGVGTLSWVLFLPFSLLFGWFARSHGVRQAGWFLAAAALLIALLLIASTFRRRPPVVLEKSPEEIACQELVELVTDYLEGVLPPDRKDAVRQHLNDCDGCTEYVHQIGLTIEALQQAGLHLTPRPAAPDG